MTTEMVSYYARRAVEYEKIYQLPAWQRDLDASDPCRARIR